MRDAGGISDSGGLIERPSAPSDPRSPPCKTSKRWTKAELSQLKVLCDQNLSDQEIAKRLSRSRKAVRTMILRQGGKHIREATRAWTAAEAELALSMHSQGASCAAIAATLPERTELAIFRKLRLMVGAAPFATARRTQTATAAPPGEITAAPSPPVAFASPPRSPSLRPQSPSLRLPQSPSLRPRPPNPPRRRCPPRQTNPAPRPGTAVRWPEFRARRLRSTPWSAGCSPATSWF